VRNIIDIVDWDTTLKSQWYSRKKYYAEKEYPISVEQARWNEFAADETATNIALIEIAANATTTNTNMATTT
jgi:hypothetical protein